MVNIINSFIQRYRVQASCAFRQRPAGSITAARSTCVATQYLTLNPRSMSSRASSRTLKVYQLHGKTTPQNPNGVKIEVGKHTIQTDLPRSMGGCDEAPQPVEYLLAAWAGCTQATALFVWRNMTRQYRINGLPMGFVGRNRTDKKLSAQICGRFHLEFDVIAVRDERGAISLPINSDRELPTVPSRVQSLQGTINVFVWDDDNRPLQLDADFLWLLRTETENRCPIANMMIASGCQMEVDWICGKK